MHSFTLDRSHARTYFLKSYPCMLRRYTFHLNIGLEITSCTYIFCVLAIKGMSLPIIGHQLKDSILLHYSSQVHPSCPRGHLDDSRGNSYFYTTVPTSTYPSSQQQGINTSTLPFPDSFPDSHFQTKQQSPALISPWLFPQRLRTREYPLALLFPRFFSPRSHLVLLQVRLKIHQSR